MKTEEILKRLEEVESQCAAMQEALEKLKHYPELELEKIRAKNYLDAWFEDEETRLEGLITQVKQTLRSDAGRSLLGRLRKLEAVAEVALALTEDIRRGEGCADWDVVIRLERALAALEEDNGS